MKYRRLGKSGLQLSELSFGAWVTFAQQISSEVAEELMTIAYDSGVNFFDNAEAYASGQAEVVMGRILKKKGWGRDTFVVSSKVFWGGDLPNQEGLSRKHVFEACHAALRRLQVDYLDLYFCHRPDPNTPIEETVRAMSDLILQGKVLYWGTSEWSAEHIQQAHAIARDLCLVPPTMEQPEYNMFRREKVEREFAPLYENPGLGTTTWSPLASGLLTGKYNEGQPGDTRISLPSYSWLKEQFDSDETRRRLEKVKELGQVAKDLGVPLPRMALAWCLKNPNVSSVITGASKPGQIKENMKAGELVPKMSAEIMGRIDQILKSEDPTPFQMLRTPFSMILAVFLAATLNATAASEKSSAKDTEPVRLNRVSFEFAKSLIEGGHIVTGSEKPWSASIPSPEETNRFIGKSGWPQYAKWHLGVSDSLRETTKRRYKFPFGDFTNVYRSALVAAKTRAAQAHHNDIRDAATELLDMIDHQPAPGPTPVPTPTPTPKKKK